MSTSSPPSGKSRKRSSQIARRQGRIVALCLTYAWDQKHFRDDELLTIAGEPEGFALEADTHGSEIFKGLVTERAAVDAVVDARLTNWNLARMAVLDRSILRLGCYELLYCSDIPTKVVINEYIEIAKEYGSDGKTAKLVNGVLDRIAKDHRSPPGA